MKTVSMMYVNATEVIGANLPVMPPSKNRSRRMIKKINKKYHTPLFGPPVVMALPASAYKKIAKLTGAQR